MHPLTHFLLKNLHAPQGGFGIEPGSDVAASNGAAAAAVRFPAPRRVSGGGGSRCVSAMVERLKEGSVGFWRHLRR